MYGAAMIQRLAILCLFVTSARGEGESARLHALFAERYAWEMRAFPETAMSRGDYTNADRITDVSLEAIERRHEATRGHLARLLAIDERGLGADDLLSRSLFRRQLEEAVEAHQYRMYLAPVGPRSGPLQSIPQMGERVRFETQADYHNYLRRLTRVVVLLHHTRKKMGIGMREGRTPPAVTLRGVPDQVTALLDGGINALGEPFDRMPGYFRPEERRKLRRQFEEIALLGVRDALTSFRAFLVDDYIPNCRKSIAARDLPDGEAYYAFRLRAHTTTDLSAKEIHDIGMREVARIRAEMMDVIRGSDFPAAHDDSGVLSERELFEAFVGYLRTDSRFYHDDATALLDGYRAICKRVDGCLPAFFATLPRLPYGVKEMPDYMAPTQTTAFYQHGDIRNGQPGWFYANTYRLEQRPKYEMIALAMHEAVPGHHLQVALAQELENTPEFRKHIWVTAFGEGWALYSERLGIEMGLYTDPYDDFGRLLYEMWRACRLVVDTGMHAFGWSRDRAVRFMMDNTALSELNINNEVDRYIAWPGQATAYKIGELKIRALRERAETSLGERFDLRAFHDVVLGAGSVPLTVLEERVARWIAASGE